MERSKQGWINTRHRMQERASLQRDPPATSEKGMEPTGVQILANTESSSRATQSQIAAIAVDVNLLRADLREVAERVATEQKVTFMQSDVDILKASVLGKRVSGLGVCLWAAAE
ncbi:hypothetical protein NDU88_001513, partial [Pleurodeles waltl]